MCNSVVCRYVEIRCCYGSASVLCKVLAGGTYFIVCVPPFEWRLQGNIFAEFFTRFPNRPVPSSYMQLLKRSLRLHMRHLISHIVFVIYSVIVAFLVLLKAVCNSNIRCKCNILFKLQISKLHFSIITFRLSTFCLFSL